MLGIQTPIRLMSFYREKLIHAVIALYTIIAEGMSYLSGKKLILLDCLTFNNLKFLIIHTCR